MYHDLYLWIRQNIDLKILICTQRNELFGLSIGCFQHKFHIVTSWSHRMRTRVVGVICGKVHCHLCICQTAERHNAIVGERSHKFSPTIHGFKRHSQIAMHFIHIGITHAEGYHGRVSYACISGEEHFWGSAHGQGTPLDLIRHGDSATGHCQFHAIGIFYRIPRLVFIWILRH